jgi:hypothetical protein
MKTESLSVPPSAQMVELLEQPHLCKAVARLYPELREILLQTQLDITNTSNVASVGPALLGIKHVLDVLLVFRTKGELLIKQEPKN